MAADLGFVSEHQVTAALARQWSCPVLRANVLSPVPAALRRFRSTLLESSVMIPVDYVAATRRCIVAFGEGIDYSVLYAIEQMLGCHTEACMAVPSLCATPQALSGHRGESEVVFDRVADAPSCPHHPQLLHALAASEIRFAACGPHLWVRLFRPSRRPARSLAGLVPTSFQPGIALFDPPRSLPSRLLKSALGLPI